jgi:hypothetical protein
MRRHMVENLPEPFRTGMKMSNLWCKEKESGGLAITNGLKIYLPVRTNEDSLLVLRLGYYQGFNIFDLFGLAPNIENQQEPLSTLVRVLPLILRPRSLRYLQYYMIYPEIP